MSRIQKKTQSTTDKQKSQQIPMSSQEPKSHNMDERRRSAEACGGTIQMLELQRRIY